VAGPGCTVGGGVPTLLLRESIASPTRATPGRTRGTARRAGQQVRCLPRVPTCRPGCVSRQCDDELMTAQTGPDVVVVGAGVIGLSTAVCLAERGRRVEVRTEREPAQTTSAVASAMIGPAMAPPDSQAGRWEQESVAQFSSLAEQQGTGVMMRRGRLAARERVPPPPGDFAECGADELPPGFAVGYWARLPLVEMVPYLRHLAGRLAAAGGRIELRKGRLAARRRGRGAADRQLRRARRDSEQRRDPDGAAARGRRADPEPLHRGRAAAAPCTGARTPGRLAPSPTGSSTGDRADRRGALRPQLRARRVRCDAVLGVRVSRRRAAAQ